MNTLRWMNNNRTQTILQACFAVITLHLVVASLFAYDGSAVERIALASMAVITGAVAAISYPTLSRPWRGVLAATYGTAALVTGLGIHLVHVVQLGFQGTDFTGVPMAIAGGVLFVSGMATLIRLIHTWWRRLLLIPAAPVLFVYFFFPLVFAVAVTNVARPDVCCDDVPSDYGVAYEEVTFETSRGLTIAAWYVPSQNGASIITVHGAGSNRANTMDESMVLARNGYGVLMIDVEGFGESEGHSNSFGWVGARDVHAAVDYLQTRPDVDPNRIGGLGLSMGGEVMIQAAGENPELKAIVAEGATGRTAEDFEKLWKGSDNLIGLPLHIVSGLTMELLTGEPSPPPLREMITQIGPRPALLIAADIKEEKVATDLYERLGGPSVETWHIPEGDHVGALDNHPEEYESHVIAFFDKALLDGPVAIPAQD